MTEPKKELDFMWLPKQDRKLLEQFLQDTRAPMMATNMDEDNKTPFLWVNQAFEQLVGYTAAEILQKYSWEKLTAKAEDAEFDMEMARAVRNGERVSYELSKEYEHKDGHLIPVRIHVMRYPYREPFQCFLVTVYPVAIGEQLQIERLEAINELIVKMMSLITKRQTLGDRVSQVWDSYWEFATANPKLAAISTLAAIGIIFWGWQPEELANAFKTMFGGGAFAE